MRYRNQFIWAFVAMTVFGLFSFANTAQAATTSASASFQSFEGGFMIWESSEGGIWVLEHGGTATYYPQSVYANRPDNPVSDAPPSGRVKPANGFGKVWGNYNSVRSALGWAYSGETGYVIRMNEVRSLGNYLAELHLSLPSGGEITINTYQDTWSGDVNSGPTPTPVPPSPTPRDTGYVPPFSNGSSLATTMQIFENGFMIWIAGTGDVFVFNAATGLYERFAVWEYAGRPDNPVTERPPAGLIKPGFGFGKVWGNFWRVRNGLGWATGGEQGLLLPFVRMYNNKLSYETFGFDTETYGFVRLDPVQGTWGHALPVADQ